jgi:hypothetical protein
MVKKTLGAITVITLLVCMISCRSSPVPEEEGFSLENEFPVHISGEFSQEPYIEVKISFDQLDIAIGKTYNNLSSGITSRLRIAILPPGSINVSAGRYVFDELFGMFLSSGYNMTSRASIDTAVREIEFGLTGLLPDETAVRLGSLLGAQIIIFGDLSGLGTENQQMVFRALEVETGRVLGISTEEFD